MKTLQQLCPEIGTEQLRLIWREVEQCIPQTVDTHDYSYEDSAQDFMLGYVQCSIEATRALQDFIGAEPMLDRLNRGEG